eukprot:6492335-Amphidinium_carterae.1
MTIWASACEFETKCGCVGAFHESCDPCLGLDCTCGYELMCESCQYHERWQHVSIASDSQVWYGAQITAACIEHSRTIVDNLCVGSTTCWIDRVHPPWHGFIVCSCVLHFDDDCCLVVKFGLKLCVFDCVHEEHAWECTGFTSGGDCKSHDMDSRSDTIEGPSVGVVDYHMIKDFGHGLCVFDHTHAEVCVWKSAGVTCEGADKSHGAKYMSTCGEWVSSGVDDYRMSATSVFELCGCVHMHAARSWEDTYFEWSSFDAGGRAANFASKKAAPSRAVEVFTNNLTWDGNQVPPPLPPFVPRADRNQLHERVRIASVNVNSLPRHFDSITTMAEEGQDVICVQEHLVPESDLDIVCKKLRLDGWSTVMTAAPLGASGRPTGGTAVLARHPYTLIPSTSPMLQSAHEDGRVASAWLLKNGKPLLHILTLYGPVDPLVNLEKADWFWTQVANWVACHAQQPLCVCGDYNLVPGENQFADSLLAQGQLSRTIDPFETPRLATHTAGRAIDHIYHSQVLASAIEDARTERVWRFPSHRAVTTTMDLSKVAGYDADSGGVTLNTPMALPVSKAMREQLARMPWEHLQQQFQTAMLDEDVDSALQFWSERWEQATIQAADDLGIQTSIAMEGRAKGELAEMVAPHPVATKNRHLPLELRQLRRTWSMMKTWLLEDAQATSFAQRFQLARRQRQILKRALHLHQMKFEFISACSVDLLKKRLDAEGEQMKHLRVEHWREQMQQMGPACRYVRGEFVDHPVALVDEKGDLRVGHAQRAEALEQYWKGVAQPPPGVTLDSVTQFVETKLARLPIGEDFDVSKFTASSIRHACKATKKNSAPGPSYWRIGEISQLPTPALAELAMLFNLILRVGKTPLDWHTAWVSYIPKCKGQCGISQLRPITVTPQLWRVFARHLNNDIVAKLDSFLHRTQFGARPGRSSVTPALAVRAFADKQKHANQPGYLTQLDIQKCFNGLNVDDGIRILQHYGLSPPICEMLSVHYDSLTTRSKLSPTWGSKPFRCTRGCPQGCPLSVTLANMILSLIPLGVSLDAELAMFLDDTSVFASRRDQVTRASCEALKNIRSLGLVPNAAKSTFVVFGSATDETEPLKLDGMSLAPTHRTDLLGFDLNTHPPERASGKQQTRSQTASTRLERSARLPVPAGHRQHVIGAMVASLWRWSPLDFVQPVNYTNWMRRQMMNAMESKQHPWELAVEVETCVLYKGHMLDCAWAAFHSAALLLKMAARQHPAIASMATDDFTTPGTMLEVFDTHLKNLQLTRNGLCVSSDDVDGLVVDLGSDVSDAICGHELRELVRRHGLTKLAMRRPREFHGAQHGVIGEWVRDALRSATTKHQYHALKRFVTGSYLCRERLARRQKDKSPLCSLCGETETMEHITMDCPMLPSDHRQYVREICHDGARALMAKTGLPCDLEIVRNKGRAAYITFSHHVATCLVRRNVLDANTPERWPRRLRLRGKQRRPLAYALADGGVRPPKTEKRPNLAQRVALSYQVEDDGAWRINGHEMEPMTDDPEPRLKCRLCNITSIWAYKHLLCGRKCDKKATRKVYTPILSTAPKFIEVSKSVLTCKRCGATGTTKHSVHFVTKHSKCRR